MKKALAILTISVLSGCASNSPFDKVNKEYIDNKSPLRMMKDHSFEISNSTKYIEHWAGEKGNTALTDQYVQQILGQIKMKCGYGKREFVGYHIVKHTKSTWEEVWLFKDSESARKDGISGQTVFLKYEQATNLTITDIYGQCHTPAGMSFIIAN